MTRDQLRRLGTRLEAYAPAVESVTFTAHGLHSVVVDQQRIDRRFLEALHRLGLEEGFTVLLSGPAGDASDFVTVDDWGGRTVRLA